MPDVSKKNSTFSFRARILYYVILYIYIYIFDIICFNISSTAHLYNVFVILHAVILSLCILETKFLYMLNLSCHVLHFSYSPVTTDTKGSMYHLLVLGI